MKVLHISTCDRQGGAFIAAHRLYQGLREKGIDSRMLVQTKLSDEANIISSRTKVQKGLEKIKTFLDVTPLALHPERDKSLYSLQWCPDNLASEIARISPDIIHLHWVNGGYLRIETLAKLKQPLVWTIHDMWPFTGGCHYSSDCEKYTKSCGACPQLNSTKEWDLSRWVWQRKAKAWKNLDLTVVTPSKWLAKCANDSTLFCDVPTQVIPNGLDIEKYKPVDKVLAKSLLGLPLDKQIVMFGAINPTDNPRKGATLLLSALQSISQPQLQDRMHVAVFGASKPTNIPDFGFETHYIGRLSDDISLSLTYSAADVFVAPSIQDNLPNTVMEALACGTPCVAFNIGGMPDLIANLHNGYLARPFCIEDFARGIVWVLEDLERHHQLCNSARMKVEQEFALSIQSQNYLNLYNQKLS
jgi:glycosyltransferase involved in cell wall biosynthesis